MRSKSNLPNQTDNPHSKNNKKRDQVIVTMHASKLKIRQDKNRTYKNWDSKSIKKGKYIRAHRSPRLLLELK
jgi:hypothetical protein